MSEVTRSFLLGKKNEILSYIAIALSLFSLGLNLFFGMFPHGLPLGLSYMFYTQIFQRLSNGVVFVIAPLALIALILGMAMGARSVVRWLLLVILVAITLVLAYWWYYASQVNQISMPLGDCSVAC